MRNTTEPSEPMGYGCEAAITVAGPVGLQLRRLVSAQRLGERLRLLLLVLLPFLLERTLGDERGPRRAGRPVQALRAPRGRLHTRAGLEPRK